MSKKHKNRNGSRHKHPVWYEVTSDEAGDKVFTEQSIDPVQFLDELCRIYMGQSELPTGNNAEAKLRHQIKKARGSNPEAA